MIEARIGKLDGYYTPLTLPTLCSV